MRYLGGIRLQETTSGLPVFDREFALDTDFPGTYLPNPTDCIWVDQEPYTEADIKTGQLDTDSIWYRGDYVRQTMIYYSTCAAFCDSLPSHIVIRSKRPVDFLPTDPDANELKLKPVLQFLYTHKNRTILQQKRIKVNLPDTSPPHKIDTEKSEAKSEILTGAFSILLKRVNLCHDYCGIIEVNLKFQYAETDSNGLIAVCNGKSDIGEQ
jgi:hypothetical protein